MKKRSFFIVFTLTFIAGAAIGFLAGNLTAGRKYVQKSRGRSKTTGNTRNFWAGKIGRDLKLSEEQKVKLAPVIDKWHVKMTELHKNNAPVLENIFSSMYDEIEPMLNEEQQKELEKYREKTRKYIMSKSGIRKTEKNNSDPVTVDADATTDRAEQ